jgi:hypothetical protein
VALLFRNKINEWETRALTHVVGDLRANTEGRKGDDGEKLHSMLFDQIACKNPANNQPRN